MSDDLISERISEIYNGATGYRQTGAGCLDTGETTFSAAKNLTADAWADDSGMSYASGAATKTFNDIEALALRAQKRADGAEFCGGDASDTLNYCRTTAEGLV